MKVIIAGGRDFSDYEFLVKTCDELLKDVEGIEIVSGAAAGADTLGESYAIERDYKLTQFFPDWERYGKAAGYRRNVQMGDYGDMLIAFWNGASKGTGHMIAIAQARRLKVHIINY